VSRRAAARFCLLSILGLASIAGARPAVVRGSDDGLAGVVRVKGRPQRDVVVWLEGVTAAAPTGRRKIVLDQRNLQFSPRVLAVSVGTQVEMPNSDRVFHNVFSFHDGKRFDLGLYPVGTAKVVTFDKPGLSRIFCNIHPTMAAYVMAVDSSLVGVSDADGKLEIAGARPGRYEYHAWRPGAEIISGSLTVSAGREIEVAWP